MLYFNGANGIKITLLKYEEHMSSIDLLPSKKGEANEQGDRGVRLALTGP